MASYNSKNTLMSYSLYGILVYIKLIQRRQKMLTIDRREGQCLLLNDTNLCFEKLIDSKTISVIVNNEFRGIIKLGSSITIEDSEVMFLSYREFPLSKGGTVIKARIGIDGDAIVKRTETLENYQDIK